MFNFEINKGNFKIKTDNDMYTFYNNDKLLFKLNDNINSINTEKYRKLLHKIFELSKYYNYIVDDNKILFTLKDKTLFYNAFNNNKKYIKKTEILHLPITTNLKKINSKEQYCSKCNKLIRN